ncbi:MAG: proton-conducting transporter membrane subunit [Gammaproteobacteria bacterium]
MSGAAFLAGAVSIPLFGAVLIPLARRWPNLREGISLGAAVALFTAVCAVYTEVVEGLRPSVVLFEPIPGLTLGLAAEPLGVLFALVASFLWILTTVYSIGYMRAHGGEHQTRFYTCFALALGSAMGIAFSANALSLFVFYEVLTLSTYPLVTHSGTDEAKRAGRLYLGLLLGTSIGLFLLALVWTWSIAGTLAFEQGGVLRGKASPSVLALLLGLYLFGIGKAALMPFHRWLPAAMVAPTPVSALLHAVAVVKAGVFAILKISVYIFGLDLLAEIGATHFLAYLAAFTMLSASLVAMRKDNLKARLAYSTISQQSYVVLGALLANGKGAIGGAMHITMHAFGKITLFFCAGAILITTHKTLVSELGGIGRAMPVTMSAFLIGSLCVIGLPPAGGVWSKWFLALAALDAGQQFLLLVLMLSSLLSMSYLLPIPAKAFFSKGWQNGATITEAPLPCLLAIVTSATGCIMLFVFPDPIYRLLGSTWVAGR